MGVFYSRLSYSIGNEDWKTEQNALKILPTDRILCVTASGDRPLNLLYSECKEIVAIDANPFQNALLDLKKEAMRHLNYEDYLGFLGAHEHSDRKKIYQTLTKSLSQESRNIWNNHLDKIQKGILYQGAVEKLTKLVSQCIGAFRKEKVDELFSFSSLEKQRQFVEEKWNTRPWKMAFDLVLNKFVTNFFILKDPGLYQNIDSSIQMNDYVYSRMLGALKRFPARESIIISLVLSGKVFEEGYSAYLLEEGCRNIRSQLDKITFKTIDLISFLEKSPDNSFDCFSLSDVASYMSENDFIRLSKAIVRTSKPGARFCIRQLMSRYSLPKEVSYFLKRDIQLEHALEQQDRCFLYHFTVGNVCK